MNGYLLFEYNSEYIYAASIYSTPAALNEDDICYSNFYVLDGEDYITVLQASELGLYTDEQLIEFAISIDLEWSFVSLVGPEEVTPEDLSTDLSHLAQSD